MLEGFSEIRSSSSSATVQGSVPLPHYPTLAALSHTRDRLRFSDVFSKYDDTIVSPANGRPDVSSWLHIVSNL